MTSKLVRMSLMSEDILKRYGRTPSDGVLAMEQKIKELSVNRQLTLSEADWKRIEDLFRPPVNKPLTFQPASTIKTIGKINEDEKLQEPIGRQGRAL